MGKRNRAALTMAIANLEGFTTVQVVTCGGGVGGLLDYDWGSAEAFEKKLRPP